MEQVCPWEVWEASGSLVRLVEGVSLLKSVKTRGCDCFLKRRDSNADIEEPENQGNVTIPIPDPKDMEICDLPEKKSKHVLRKLSELQKTQTIQHNQDNNT